MKLFRTSAVLAVALLLGMTLTLPSCRADSRLKKIENQIGERDAVLIAEHGGRVLMAKNADRPLIPASTLKIFTALVALHYLGPDYRFATEFYIDDAGNLTIRGHGDPLLISEILAEITLTLKSRTGPINDIVLDDSYFAQPLVIPGVSSSSEPYDAPNGALCVNFNTVFFKKENGTYVSAESQTPLLPIVRPRIESSRLKAGRIVLSHEKDEITLYSGHLFAFFLRQAGISVNGRVLTGRVRPDKDRLLLRWLSPFTLTETIARMLAYSNNYITNQLLITAGAEVYGPPGTLEKGVRAARDYADAVLHLDGFNIIEGSGISRENRITARDMLRVLEAFSPYHTLMRREGRQYFKTGTLKGISTRAGYLEGVDGNLRPFVVLVNSPGKSAERLTRRLLQALN